MGAPAPNTIPTEPIGSIPRPIDLIERVAKADCEDPSLALSYEDAIRDTIQRFEATVSEVVTDGKQRKYQNFATYCVHGLPNTAPDGFKVKYQRPKQWILLGVTAPIDPQIDSPEAVRSRSFELCKNWHWCRGRQLIFN
jgi:hypothetical protein